MSIGNASIRRAAGAMKKQEEKPAVPAFRVHREIAELPLSAIDAPAFEGSTQELQKSVRKYGILLPVTVLREGERFLLADGAARIAAARALGLENVPAVVVEPEGRGAASARKDALARVSARPAQALSEELAVTDDIHEGKFEAIRSIGSDLPPYLL